MKVDAAIDGGGGGGGGKICCRKETEETFAVESSDACMDVSPRIETDDGGTGAQKCTGSGRAEVKIERGN